jgi:hypothetical protein
MKLLSIVAISAIVACAAPAAGLSPSSVSHPLASDEFAGSSLDKLDSVEMPGWSLHFGICRYPGLNKLQKAKERIWQLRADIELHERAIAEKRAEMERILAVNAESREESLFLLGLYSRSTCVKDFALICDEKSILWGAVKWGKRRP